MKKFFYGILFIVVLIAAGAWFTWQQIFSPTEWAQQPQSSGEEVASTAPARPTGGSPSPELARPGKAPVAQPGNQARQPRTPTSAGAQLAEMVKRKQAALAQTGSVRITPQEIDLAIRAGFEARFPGQGNLVLKQVQSQIAPDAITVNMVVDVTRIPEEDLPSQLRMMIAFMKKTNRKALENFYLQIKGKPEVVDGTLQLDQAARLRMGQFEYPLNDLLKMFTGSERLELSSLEGLDRVHAVELQPDLLIVR